jgi:hypothetical protein
MGLAKVLHDEQNKKCDDRDDDAGKDREPSETWAALSKMPARLSTRSSGAA